MKNQRAQNLAEYTICLAAVILAVVMMHPYVRRALQGRYRDVADYATSRLGSSGRAQFEPNYVVDNSIVQKNANIQEDKQPQGVGTITVLQDETTRNGTSTEGMNPYVER